MTTQAVHDARTARYAEALSTKLPNARLPARMINALASAVIRDRLSQASDAAPVEKPVWDARSLAFARQASRLVPHERVDLSTITELAALVVKSAAVRSAAASGIALDEEGEALESALQALSDFIVGLNLSADDRDRALELANSVATASEKDARLKAAAEDRKRPRARDRQAQDARPSQIDRILAGAPSRRFIAGR